MLAIITLMGWLHESSLIGYRDAVALVVDCRVGGLMGLLPSVRHLIPNCSQWICMRETASPFGQHLQCQRKISPASK